MHVPQQLLFLPLGRVGLDTSQALNAVFTCGMVADVFVIPLDGPGLDLFKLFNLGATLILADHSVIRAVTHYAIRHIRFTAVMLALMQ
ncbi:MAG: hypothetical protein ACC655_05445 [Rhodothermia bacterium]